MVNDTTIRKDNGGNRRQIGLSLLAGPLVWALHMSVVYPVTSLACAWDWFPGTLAGMPGLQAFQLFVTIIAALVVAAAGFSAWANWRRLRADVPDDEPETALSPFGAFLGVLSNALFFVAIILSVVPIFTLSPCA